MPLLIDTYNVLHITGVLPVELAGLDVASLAELVSISRYGRERVILVCDGHVQGLPEAIGKVEVVRVGVGRDADSYIETAIARSSAPRDLTVVSSDRRIIRAARKRRSSAVKSDVFLAQIVSDARKRRRAFRDPPYVQEVPLSGAGVNWWLEQMGMEIGPAGADEQSWPRSSATKQRIAGTTTSSDGSGRQPGPTPFGQKLRVPKLATEKQPRPSRPASPPGSPAGAAASPRPPKPALPAGRDVDVDPELRRLLDEAGIDAGLDALDMAKWFGPSRSEEEPPGDRPAPE
jgi:predicted RNA-binding protein with PIN domain